MEANQLQTMSNLRQSMTEDELEALRNEKPLILSVSLDFQTAVKLNEMFERDQKKIDDLIERLIHDHLKENGI